MIEYLDCRAPPPAAAETKRMGEIISFLEREIACDFAFYSEKINFRIGNVIKRDEM